MNLNAADRNRALVIAYPAKSNSGVHLWSAKKTMSTKLKIQIEFENLKMLEALWAESACRIEQTRTLYDFNESPYVDYDDPEYIRHEEEKNARASAENDAIRREFVSDSEYYPDVENNLHCAPGDNFNVDDDI